MLELHVQLVLADAAYGCGYAADGVSWLLGGIAISHVCVCKRVSMVATSQRGGVA